MILKQTHKGNNYKTKVLIIQDYTTDIEHFKTNTEGTFQDYYNTHTKGLENEEGVDIYGRV